MRRFTWKLNWLLNNTYAYDNTSVDVYFDSVNSIIGTCLIQFRGNDVIGHFDLTQDLHDDEYVLYNFVVEEDSLLVLGGIMISNFYSERIKKPRTVAEMNSINGIVE